MVHKCAYSEFHFQMHENARFSGREWKNEHAVQEKGCFLGSSPQVDVLFQEKARFSGSIHQITSQRLSRQACRDFTTPVTLSLSRRLYINYI